MDLRLFEKFQQLILQQSGIYLNEGKVALLSARIGNRMRDLGESHPGGYFERVVSDSHGVELGELIDAISTNVTHFFREAGHFDFLAKWMQSQGEEGRRQVRVWSAACSTGEEPYSIAITLNEHRTSSIPFEIIASDLSNKALEIARFGVYRAHDIRFIQKEWVRKYFQEGAGKASFYVRVKPWMRELIDFRRINLASPQFTQLGELDVIFCRNVMIFFKDQTRRELIHQFHSMLRPKGILVVGLSESLGNKYPMFNGIQPSVYQKK